MRVHGPLAGVLALLVLSMVPSAAADHPGSNLGLARFGPLNDQAVHRLPDVELAFSAWEAQYPDLVDRFVIGQTGSGFDLLGIRITDESVGYTEADLSTGAKLRVYLDGGHHGNEFLGVDIVMYYLEDLLESAGDEAVAQFLRETEIFAVPIINVDGNTLDTRKNSRLVDPNRNYDYQWGGPGSGDTPIDFTYRGPSPFSEPETKANADFATSIMPNLWITMHTGIAEFYWPWGWTHDPSPDDKFFTSLEKPFEDATNGRVDAMQAAELYLAAGATDDWGYAVLGVPTFTYEIHEDQFVPVYGEPIPEVIADQLAGLDFMVKNVKMLGPWIDLVETTVGLELTNLGWADAHNVTVMTPRGEVFVPFIATGETVSLSGAGGPGLAEVSFKTLLIGTAPTRIQTFTLGSGAGPQVPTESLPAGPVLVVVLLGMLHLLWARRKA